jgi:hypothetical protein
MKLNKQIKIVETLIEAIKELNGEFQEGWEEDIEEAEALLNYLKTKI